MQSIRWGKNYSNSLVVVAVVVKLNVTIWVERVELKLESLHCKLDRVYVGPSNKRVLHSLCHLHRR